MVGPVDFVTPSSWGGGVGDVPSIASLETCVVLIRSDVFQQRLSGTHVAV